MIGTSTSATARAPGKLILSGEHAVVHGRPALVTAVDRYATCTLAPRPDRTVRIQLPSLGREKPFTFSALRQNGEELKLRYEEFLCGDRPIAEVAPVPEDRLAFALQSLLERCFIKPKRGWDIVLSSDVPPGCGMGSSAATVTSLLRAAAAAVGAPMDADRLYAYSLEAEKLQHGKPSGVDPYISAHGGCVRFRQGKAESSPALPLARFCLVDTGAPDSTTGECVMDVSRRLGQSGIWDEVEAVTLDMEIALQAHQPERLADAVRRNHALLVQIGVVPATVHRFIREAEARGGAGKICGAGAIRGEAAGVVWLVNLDNPEALCRAFGFRPSAVKPAATGAELLS
jgi:mevalonate kinase